MYKVSILKIYERLWIPTLNPHQQLNAKYNSSKMFVLHRIPAAPSTSKYVLLKEHYIQVLTLSICKQ